MNKSDTYTIIGLLWLILAHQIDGWWALFPVILSAINFISAMFTPSK